MKSPVIKYLACSASILLGATTVNAQMKNARDFEREREAKPAYRIILENGRFKLQKPKRTSSEDALKASLIGTEWELIAPTYAGLTQSPNLKFTQERIGASVGCNSLGAAFEVKGETLTVSQVIATRMACEEPIMRAEASYVASLQGTHKAEISTDGKRLMLRREGQKLTFRRVNQSAGEWRSEGTKIINVEPTLGPMMDGDATPKYLQLEDLSEGTSWGKFSRERIEGFNFQQGNQYQLQVMVERNAKTGENRLRLQEIISQKFLGKWVPQANEAVWEVAPTRVDCELGPEKCLQIRVMGGEPFTGQWRALSQNIEGFDYQDGYKFRLAVRTLGTATSPRYQLIRVLDKMPVTL